VAGNGTQSTRLLVVSREPSALGPLWAIGEANSWQLETACSGWEALERVHSDAGPDLVLLDLAQGDADGLHTLRWLRRVRPDVPIILLSYPHESEQKAQAFRLGARDYLVRPLQGQELEIVIKRHLTGKNGNGDMEIASDDIEQISDDMFFVAASPMMRKLRAQAELLAQVNVPVLILGESGSGKEIAARLIHRLSVRSSFRFLKVNCAALPGDLLESELFGYERGAFTGAMRTKPGKFELCEKGTILLDEFTEMPTGLQAKLLHVLQDKQFFRLGGERMIDVDVRILAATNVNIEQALAEKKLREDLYYRLSAFTVHVPPLRQRRDEIPLLLGHFMNQLARHYGLHPQTISPTMADACQSYSWPGNLRELENFVKRYLVMGDEELALGELERNSEAAAETVYPPQTSSRPTTEVESAEFEEGPSSLKSLVQSVKGEAERNAITAALGKTHWNRKAAARLLQISYRTLLYKIEQYHMSPRREGAFFVANSNHS
jgi:two-component system, NtrC family, response regulator AtoC